MRGKKLSMDYEGENQEFFKIMNQNKIEDHLIHSSLNLILVNDFFKNILFCSLGFPVVFNLLIY